VDATAWIALVSLVIAIVALVVAVFAAVYARRQATEAARANRLAEQRHHEDIAPAFVLSLHEASDWHVRLLLELVPGHLDLDSVEVDIIDDGNLDGELVTFSPDQYGVHPGQQPPRRVASWPRMLPRGERAIWRVELPERQRAPRLRVRVASQAGERHWSTVVETSVPPAVGDTFH